MINQMDANRILIGGRRADKTQFIRKYMQWMIECNRGEYDRIFTKPIVTAVRNAYV